MLDESRSILQTVDLEALESNKNLFASLLGPPPRRVLVLVLHSLRMLTLTE